MSLGRAPLRTAVPLAAFVMTMTVGVGAHGADDASTQEQLRRLSDMAQQLRAAQAESEARIRQLNEQIQMLQKSPPTAVTQVPPPFDARNVTVTQQPGNL